MKDDLIFQKKVGMTVSKAWIFFLSMFIVQIVAGAIVGFEIARGKAENNPAENPYSLTILYTLGAYLLLCLIAYFINKKEFPRFFSPSFKNVGVALLLAVFIRIVTSILEDVPFSLITQEQIEQMGEVNYGIIAIQSLVVIFFQIGFIGHGLLRNYDFSTAVVTTTLVSIIHFEPKAIVAMIILVGVLLYMYYKTASFWLVLITGMGYMYIDVLMKLFFDFNIFDSNNWRTVIIGNDNIYYALWALSILGIGALIALLSKAKSPEWRRADELLEF